MRTKVSYATIAEVERDTMLWAQEIEKTFKPEIIVFLAKSGFLYAKPLAEYFDIPMVDLAAGRAGNRWKDLIRRYMPFIPKRLISLIVSSPLKYKIHGKKTERNLKRTKRYKRVDISQYKRVLLVDDTADTGWSLVEALCIIKTDIPMSQVKTACYCITSLSQERVKIDFYRYKNVIVISGASRYSDEYERFLGGFSFWKKEWKLP